MKIGTAPPDTATLATPRDVVTYAQSAEALGFASLRAGEHLVYPAETKTPYPYTPDGSRVVDTTSNHLELFTLFSFLTGQTKRIRFQTGVCLISLRSFFASAKSIATLDYLSGGRFSLEVGVGWMRDEFDILKVPFHERGAITDDMLAAFEAIFATGDGYEGKYVSFPKVNFNPKPIQRPFPVSVGSGINPSALRRVVRFAQGWTPIGVSLSELAQTLPQLSTMMKEANRDMASLDIQGMIRLGANDIGNGQPLLEELERMQTLGLSSVKIDLGQANLSNLDEALERMRWVADLAIPRFGTE
jgi:probable F420-dependent oxidoreductase